ncbi:MAG: siderophore-interacting protein, partial [Streptosporangiaceae bacterium]
MAYRTEVLSTERITPHLIRLVVGGTGLEEFTAGEFTDHYVKVIFRLPGVTYPEPFDLEAIRRDLPRDQWPVNRSYTVRAWDATAQRLTLDFVHHGDIGLGGPWAAGVRPGEEILLTGPGGSYAPRPEAGWHLLVGDESALPAIAVALERLPADAPARVFLEVEGPQDELLLETPGKAEIVWVHRRGTLPGELLVPAVKNLEFPPGTVHAFVHGEAGFVKELRRHLRVERGLSLDQLSISGYWRRGADDEGWRASKAE